MNEPADHVRPQRGQEASRIAMGVVGIGSPFDRNDLQAMPRDGAADSWGWALVEELIDLPSHVTVRNARHPLDLLDWIEDFDSLHIVDSLQWSDRFSCDLLETKNNRPASTISQPSWNDDHFRLWKWDVKEIELQMQFKSDSHSLGLVEVLSIAKSMGWTPAGVTLWGVEVLPCRDSSSNIVSTDDREAVQKSLKRMGEWMQSVMMRESLPD